MGGGVQEGPRARAAREGRLAHAWTPLLARSSAPPVPRPFRPSPQPPPRCRRTPQSGHLGVLSLPKGLCYPLPQVSAQVPAPFGLVHWPFLTELKETPVTTGRHFGPRLSPPFEGGVGAKVGACAHRLASFPGGGQERRSEHA